MRISRLAPASCPAVSAVSGRFPGKRDKALARGRRGPPATQARWHLPRWSSVLVLRLPKTMPASRPAVRAGPAVDLAQADSYADIPGVPSTSGRRLVPTRGQILTGQIV